MSLLEAILLGIIQGVAEFLPISSSGHLAIFKNIFKVNTDTGMLFDIMLHLGTLVAVFIVYWDDIKKLIIEGVGIIVDFIKNSAIYIHNLVSKDKKHYSKVVNSSYRKFVMMVIVSTIPTGIIGILIKDYVESASESLLIPGIGLLITATLLLISDKVKEGTKTPKTATYKNALIVGLFQGVATIPGISRSGTTITTSLLNGFDRKFAVKYSFIMSIPAILGAALLEVLNLKNVTLASGEIINYVIGTIVSALVGYMCIKWILVLVQNRKFKYFAIYCYLAGIIAIIGNFII
ncbi:MAG: undecaprenyl-diphosphate phosphatase [Clostridiales bacterium]|nr:undecaprenyl-diphosphate phosphatase [Clostridiales bacterium]